MNQDNRGYGPTASGQNPNVPPHWGQPNGGYGYPNQAPLYQPGMGQRSSTIGSILPRDRFLKGLLIGAAATYLLTNEQVQRTAIKGVVQAWSLLQGGLEEVKERFGDAQAELHHTNQRQTVE